MVSKVFEHPFDLCKVRLQAQVLDDVKKYNGPIDCLHKTWKYEGVRGLYRVRLKWSLSWGCITNNCWLGLTFPCGRCYV